MQVMEVLVVKEEMVVQVVQVVQVLQAFVMPLDNKVALPQPFQRAFVASCQLLQ